MNHRDESFLRQFSAQHVLGLLVSLCLALLGLALLRGWQIYGAFRQTEGCGYQCVTLSTLANDLEVLGLVLTCALLGRWSRGCLRWACSLAGQLLIALYAIDILIYTVLKHRLDVADIFKYGGQVRLNESVVMPAIYTLTGLAWLVLLVLSELLFSTLLLSRGRGRKAVLGLCMLLPVLVSAEKLSTPPAHISKNVFESVLAAMLPEGENRAFSPAYQAQLQAAPEPEQQCRPGDGQFRPVILLVVESLSLYQSQAQSGIHDYLPELDRIAAQYAYFDQFYANGFTTDGGLISLLTGHFPLPNINRYQSAQAYMGFEHASQDAFQKLAAAHIQARYFRSADLEFIGTGEWLKALGFVSVEGPENPFYDGMPRGSFNEPGDAALYRRYLSWLDEQPAHSRFFSVIQTTTTHPPFVIPGQAEGGEEKAFRYADQQIGDFVRALEQRHFFDQGILLITGDHRSMTFTRPQEVAQWGKEAMSRIPAILVGGAGVPKGRIPGRWQQVDFLPSLLAAAGLDSCTSDYQGRFLVDAKPAKYILHAEGVERDRILVRTQDDPVLREIQMAGDDTHWAGPALAGSAGPSLVAEVNRQRAVRPDAPSDLGAGLLRIYGMLP
ncbi:LTA synthase family protein [Curvibacter sp. RS43]|uniref:LTA synthase family protein n=1 Tax=Curvibacter microcysteis TaxID=3026419 RepID=UPI002361A7A1|nr:LTA synthase family protein [Curvibacter sp. RS43]MDD0811769.1 LTA synthase family protein [Curvibacter sp. RS43]